MPERYLQLAEEIRLIFLNERVGVYYTPAVPRTPLSDGTSANGKLIQQYVNLERKDKKFKKTLDTGGNINEKKNRANNEDDTAVIADKLKFLEQQLEPWTQIV